MAQKVYRKQAYHQQDHDKTEVMKVTQLARFKEVGADEAVTKVPGDEVKLTGTDKKASYYDDLVCYPDEFEKVMAAKKSKYAVSTEGSKTPESMEALSGKESKKK